MVVVAEAAMKCRKTRFCKCVHNGVKRVDKFDSFGWEMGRLSSEDKANEDLWRELYTLCHDFQKIKTDFFPCIIVVTVLPSRHFLWLESRNLLTRGLLSSVHEIVGKIFPRKIFLVSFRKCFVRKYFRCLTTLMLLLVGFKKYFVLEHGYKWV